MPPWLRITLIVLCIIGATGLVIYTFVRALQRSEDPVKILLKWLVTLALGGLYYWFVQRKLAGATGSLLGDFGSAFQIGIGAIVLAVILTPMWATHIAHTLFSPITSLFDGGGEQVEPAPLYSRAETLRNRGKCREAIYAIHEELEKFPNDFRGQMLIAEILAENLNDLPGAEATIQRICAQKEHAPGQIAAALTHLADWHLHYDQDVDAARAAFEEVIARFPETEIARHASNRIAHLSEAGRFVDAREPHALVMKLHDEYAPLPKPAELVPEIDLRAEAERLSQHLTAYPNDTEAREELAKIYADGFKRLDLATEQLEMLIALPSESPRRIAHWLNLLADLQVRCTGTTELAAATLNRIIERFPKQSFAEAARARLATLSLETKRYEKSRVVKLASS